MTLAQPHSKQLDDFIANVRSIWTADSPTDAHCAQQVARLMQTWLQTTPSDTDWVASLKADQHPGRPLYTDAEHGFIQMSHFHEGQRSNSPHDHGPYWVVYGVFEGTVEIPLYEVNADGETCSEIERHILTAGDAVAYLPGQIHSTKVPTDAPAVVLRFLSQDLSQVPRVRFKRDQIV